MFTSTTARFHCPEHKRRDDDDLADTNDKVTLDVRTYHYRLFQCIEAKSCCAC
jgi:hypothetical protein